MSDTACVATSSAMSTFAEYAETSGLSISATIVAYSTTELALPYQCAPEMMPVRFM